MNQLIVAPRFPYPRPAILPISCTGDSQPTLAVTVQPLIRLDGDMSHTVTGIARVKRVAESEVGMATPERRVVWCMGQVEEGVQATAALLDYIGQVGPLELELPTLRRLADVARIETRQLPIAIQWVEAGERIAVAELLNADVGYARRYEREVAQAAAEVGLELGKVIQFPYPMSDEPEAA